MGQNSSKNEEFEEYWKYFNQQEQQQLQEFFKQMTNNKPTVTEEQLNKKLYTTFPKYICHRLYQELLHPLSCTGSSLRHEASFKNMVIFLAHITKKSVMERYFLVKHLALNQPNEVLTHEELCKFIEDITQAFIVASQKDSNFLSWHYSHSTEILQGFSKDLLHNLKRKDQGSTSFNIDDDSLQRWLSNTPLFVRMLETAFLSAFAVLPAEFHPQGSLIPRCQNINWTKSHSILNIPSILLLNSHLPVELREDWCLLYSTELHGESFSTFISYTSNKGPLLVVIKDKDGYIFGGFTAESLQFHAYFKGNNRCFLFTLAPSMAVYDPSGLNENYLYVNFGQQTLPNGFGMGGQFDYFGLWIDSSFEWGHSKAEPKCLTYDSPQLSLNVEFKIDWMEVWRVGPELEIKQQEQKASILDSNVEAKALLKLVDKGFKSEGLREEPKD